MKEAHRKQWNIHFVEDKCKLDVAGLDEAIKYETQPQSSPNAQYIAAISALRLPPLQFLQLFSWDFDQISSSSPTVQPYPHQISLPPIRGKRAAYQPLATKGSWISSSQATRLSWTQLMMLEPHMHMTFRVASRSIQRTSRPLSGLGTWEEGKRGEANDGRATRWISRSCSRGHMGAAVVKEAYTHHALWRIG